MVQNLCVDVVATDNFALFQKRFVTWSCWWTWVPSMDGVVKTAAVYPCCIVGRVVDVVDVPLHWARIHVVVAGVFEAY